MNQFAVWDDMDMPTTMTFDELVDHPLFKNYGERFGRWWVLLRNGWWYRQNGSNDEAGIRCNATEKLDPVYFDRGTV